MEVSEEGAELVAQHALRQAQRACGIVGRGGLAVALEVDQVAAQVEPGVSIVGVGFGLPLGGLQGVLAVDRRIPFQAQDGFERFFLVGQVHQQVDSVEDLPLFI